MMNGLLQATATEASGYEHKLAIVSRRPPSPRSRCPRQGLPLIAIGERGYVAEDRSPDFDGKADRVEKYSLDAQAREHLERALAGSAGRSAATVYGGHEHTLRQTIIALRTGTELSDHENPGEATVLVLRGRVELIDATTSWTGRQGDLLVVPQRRHRLSAHEDSVVLLTVAKVAPPPADVP